LLKDDKEELKKIKDGYRQRRIELKTDEEYYNIIMNEALLLETLTKCLR
jgi:hypothetical protein